MAQTTAKKQSSDWWRWLIAAGVALIVMVGVWYALTHLANFGKETPATAETAEMQPTGAELPMDDFTKLALEKAREGDVEGALEAFSVAIASNPEGASVPYYYRGLVYVEEGDASQAIDDFTKAIDYNKDDVHAYFNRGIAYFNIGMKRNACEDWQKAGELGNFSAYRYISRYCSK